MPLLRHVTYYKTPNRRVIGTADFRSIGVEDQNQIVWEPSNRHTVEVSEAVAEALMDVEPGEWKVVESDREASAPNSGVAGEPRKEDVGKTAGAKRAKSAQYSS